MTGARFVSALSAVALYYSVPDIVHALHWLGLRDWYGLRDDDGTTHSFACTDLDDRFPWMRGPAALQRFVRRVSPYTDKVTRHNFQHMYVQYLGRLAQRKCLGATSEQRRLRILEIGLGCGMPRGIGGSVRLWRSMFVQPIELDLHVMEFAESCGSRWAQEHPELLSEPQVTLHFGNQGSSVDLDRVLQTAAEVGTSAFDLIIDDGSHLNEHQRSTLLHMFPHLAPGGVYIIEDLQSSCENWRVNWGGAPRPRFAPERIGGTEGCMQTVQGDPTMMATILGWQMQLGGRGRTELAELPGLVHIDQFVEGAVFEREIVD